MGCKIKSVITYSSPNLSQNTIVFRLWQQCGHKRPRAPSNASWVVGSESVFDNKFRSSIKVGPLWCDFLGCVLIPGINRVTENIMAMSQNSWLLLVVFLIRHLWIPWLRCSAVKQMSWWTVASTHLAYIADTPPQICPTVQRPNKYNKVQIYEGPLFMLCMSMKHSTRTIQMKQMLGVSRADCIERPKQCTSTLYVDHW